MDSNERTTRATAFRKSIDAGRVTHDRVVAVLAGWVSAGMASTDDVATILALIGGAK